MSALSRCASSFETYLRASYFNAGFEIGLIIPNEAAKDLGATRVSCTIARIDDRQWTGTARNGGSVLPEGLTSVYDLQDGQCFDWSVFANFVRVLPCNRSHDVEVFASRHIVPANLGGSTAVTSPVERRINGSNQYCNEQFNYRIAPGDRVFAEAFPVNIIRPHTFELERLVFACGLMRTDRGKLDNSLRGRRKSFAQQSVSEFGSQENMELEFTDFSNADDLKPVGTTEIEDHAVVLTELNPGLQAGAVWYNDKVDVAGGFSTLFVFQMDNYSWFSVGDGLAFVIQNAAPDSLGIGSHGMGYSGIPNSVAIEFDSIRPDWEDSEPSTTPKGAPEVVANQVSVQTHGTNNNSEAHWASIAAADVGRSVLVDRREHVALIRYEPGKLEVYVDGFYKPVLTTEINLEEVLVLDNGKAWIGFTAGTDDGKFARHTITGWRHSSAHVPEEIQEPDANVPIPASDEISFADLTYQGSATRTLSGARLIKNDDSYQRGAIWAPTKLTVGEGFSSEFTFRIRPGVDRWGEGFALILQNQGARPLLYGGPSGLGYDGMAKSLAVEFDTSYNEGDLDPNANHIAVHSVGKYHDRNSIQQWAMLSYGTPDFLLADGKEHSVWIAYVPGLLSVFLDGASEPVLEVEVDIAKELELKDGSAWIGFGSSTDRHIVQVSEIMDWTFVSGFPEPPEGFAHGRTVGPEVTGMPVLDMAYDLTVLSQNFTVSTRSRNATTGASIEIDSDMTSIVSGQGIPDNRTTIEWALVGEYDKSTKNIADLEIHFREWTKPEDAAFVRNCSGIRQLVDNGNHRVRLILKRLDEDFTIEHAECVANNLPPRLAFQVRFVSEHFQEIAKGMRSNAWNDALKDWIGKVARGEITVR